MKFSASTHLVLTSAALLVLHPWSAYGQITPRASSPGVIERAPTNRNGVDPAREAVERADVDAKAFQQPVIDDTTVFVKGAALGALTVIELTKLAQAKSKDAGIRSLAERVLVNQRSLRTELAAVARSKKLDVPSSLISEDEQRLQEASGLSGAAFDTWYVRQLIAEHQKSIPLFEAASSMPDKELAAFARKALPVLEAERNSALGLGTL